MPEVGALDHQRSASQRHHRGLAPWRKGDQIFLRGTGNMPRPFPCQHPDVVRRANQHAFGGAARTATARSASSRGAATVLLGQWESARLPTTSRST